jgi:hypothetical protein
MNRSSNAPDYRFEPAGFDRRQALLGDRRALDEPPPRHLLKMVAVGAVMVVFAGGLWFAYYEGSRHAAVAPAGAVPLIRADGRPMMVRPAAPGGLKIPDRNMLIYNPNERLVEHLLPPPEEPMARPGAAAAPPPAATGGTAQPPVATASVPAASPAAASPPAPEHGLSSPPGGAVRLQLGSVRSAAAARLEWGRIRQRNPDLLGSLSASPVRTDLADQGVYWRIETEPLAAPAADRICGALKERKFGCLIVR